MQVLDAHVADLSDELLPLEPAVPLLPSHLVRGWIRSLPGDEEKEKLPQEALPIVDREP